MKLGDHLVVLERSDAPLVSRTRQPTMGDVLRWDDVHFYGLLVKVRRISPGLLEWDRPGGRWTAEATVVRDGAPMSDGVWTGPDAESQD